MTKRKKKSKVKKKEELSIPRELTIESIPDHIRSEVDFTYRLKAEVIDAPSYTRVYKPPMGDPIMNMLCYMMTGKSLDELDNE